MALREVVRFDGSRGVLDDETGEVWTPRLVIDRFSGSPRTVVRCHRCGELLTALDSKRLGVGPTCLLFFGGERKC